MTDEKNIQPTAGSEVFEHTADVGLRVWAESWPELCRQAGLGMIALMVALPADPPMSGRVSLSVHLSAADREQLLHAWLKHLLNLFELDGLVPAELFVKAASATELSAEVHAEPFERSRHQTELEIKAITWHEFSVNESPNGWRATIIFDI